MEIEFNNGFITSLMLFTQHKTKYEDIHCVGERDDIRLYGAVDHLFNMEIPEDLNPKIKERVEKLVTKAFEQRMKYEKNWEIADKIFKEAEDIIAMIDKEYFTKKKVIMKYR